MVSLKSQTEIELDDLKMDYQALLAAYEVAKERAEDWKKLRDPRIDSKPPVTGYMEKSPAFGTEKPLPSLPPAPIARIRFKKDER